LIELGTNVWTREIVGNFSCFESWIKRRSWTFIETEIFFKRILPQRFSEKLSFSSDFRNVEKVDVVVNFVQKSRSVSRLKRTGRRGRRYKPFWLFIVVNPAVFWPLVKSNVGGVVIDVEGVVISERLGVAVTDVRRFNGNRPKLWILRKRRLSIVCVSNDDVLFGRENVDLRLVEEV
jgi:hypothetical protein